MRTFYTLRFRYLRWVGLIVITATASAISVLNVTTSNNKCRDNDAVISSASCNQVIVTTTQIPGPTIPEPGDYKMDAAIPPVGIPTGSYTGEFFSSSKPNNPVDPLRLPDRPYLGTEVYWLDSDRAGQTERDWLEALHLDFLRIEVDARDVKKGKDWNASPLPDLTSWSASDFQSGKGWRFNDPNTTVTNVLDNLSLVKFPIMLMMHYGAESYMGDVPSGDAYADYFLITVYYFNVVRNMNIKYWEVLNEPDWGWGNPAQYCSPSTYATIFKKVAERIKNFPDWRVNSIRLGGPTLGSGDPIDGSWPNGFANRDSDGQRQWRAYIPVLLARGSRDGQHDIGFLSWHDYGSDTWGDGNSLMKLDKTYTVINRVNTIYKWTNDYADAAGERPPLVVSEFNFAAGETAPATKVLYKTFYAALWETSMLNNYLSTGKVGMLSHFYWKGNDDRPKGLVYSDEDTDMQTVRTPVWWTYKEYIDHLQNKILASYNGRVDPWVDAIVTTDKKGKMLYLIVVNKSDQPKTIDFSFDIPPSLLEQVSISKRMMQNGGSGKYGEPFETPLISDVYQFQPVTFAAGNQIQYRETIPARTIIYYTLVSSSAFKATGRP